MGFNHPGMHCAFNLTGCHSKAITATILITRAIFLMWVMQLTIAPTKAVANGSRLRKVDVSRDPLSVHDATLIHGLTRNIWNFGATKKLIISNKETIN